MASPSRDTDLTMKSKSRSKSKSKSKSKSPSKDTHPETIAEPPPDGSETLPSASSTAKDFDPDASGPTTTPSTTTSKDEKTPSPSRDEATPQTPQKKKKERKSSPKKDQKAPPPSIMKTPTGRETADDDNQKSVLRHTPKKSGRGPMPRGGHQGGMQHATLKFGERPGAHARRTRAGDIEATPHSRDPLGSLDDDFDPSQFSRMSALYFHKYNDLSRSARGVGYTPDQAVSMYGPGINDAAESLYGPCRLLTDFQYSTWTETVVPLRNHNVVQGYTKSGFNEMILFLIKLAANSEESVNHEEAFMATSFLANIRNDLGEHPPNVLALLEYIDYKTLDDGTEPANPEIQRIPSCEAADLY